MCGIFGFSRLTPVTEAMIPVLALRMEARGTHSWGVTDGIDMYKSLGAISDTFSFVWKNWTNTNNGLIFHTRAASSGSSVNIENAHPHRFNKIINTIYKLDDDQKQTNEIDYRDLRTVTGIHNGYVANHTSLKNKYPDRKDFDVDTKHIFKHIIDDAHTEEIGGSGVIAWFDTYHKAFGDNNIEFIGNKLYIARFKSTSLYIAKLASGEIVFASTEEAVHNAALFTGAEIDVEYKTNENVCYQIKTDETEGDSFIDSGLMYFTNKVYWTPAVTNQSNIVIHSGYSHHGYGRRSESKLKKKTGLGLCPICGIGIDMKNQAMCYKCFDNWLFGKVSIMEVAVN